MNLLIVQLEVDPNFYLLLQCLQTREKIKLKIVGAVT